jgi:beta-xylosidase/acetyl esterase/lipase
MNQSRIAGVLCGALLLSPCAAQVAPAGVANTYTAETTLRKLAPTYPFIRIASREAPASVEAIRDITYTSYGNRSLQLDLYLPKSRGARTMPGIVFVHGGGWRNGTRENFAPMAIRMAERGYAAATISYRLSPEAQYPAAIHDVKAAVRWLRANAARYGIDPARIAVAGGSAGGQIASLAGVTNDIGKFDPGASAGAVSSAVQAIVNIDGLSDFTSEEARKHEDDPAKQPSSAGAWFGGRYAEKEALWREASPTFYVNKNTPPILFIGSGQARFSVGREAMVEKMTALGVPSRVVVLPNTPHSFWLFDPWLEPTIDATVSFLDQHFARQQSAQAWTADLGNGSYRNPILQADYSDPDVIRVGDTFYMTSSSFSNVPGLPLLQSKDMVNWELVGHALARLVPYDVFATPQPGKGVWAPCLRYHAGKFWIFYPDPDAGIYVMTADRFEGPWSAPHLLLAGKGIIDPTPLWDDDGKAYLLHASAKSRAGFNNVLTLRRMAPDARSMLDGGAQVVIDGNKLPGYRTLEGPKFYKANGYYYVFAPAGGVEQGWQAVFRSRHIEGPYEDRIVMAQGSSPVNGPHQGAWVNAQDGSDWFFHFQDQRAYGRVVHLQPMQWRNGWPVIGEDPNRTGTGQPVLVHGKPVPGKFEIKAPATSDEFSLPELGLQWQWNANWDPSWYSLAARQGFLRLFAQVHPHAATANPLRTAAPILTQKLPAKAFTVDTRIELDARNDGDRAGLILNGINYAWLGLRRAGSGSQLVFATCDTPAAKCDEKLDTVLQAVQQPVYLRMRMEDGGVAQFSYSLDNQRFTPVGKPFTASMGRWVGAQIGLFSLGGRRADDARSYVDVDYFRVTR